MRLSFHRYVRSLCKNHLGVVFLIVIDYNNFVKLPHREEAFLEGSLHQPGRGFKHISRSKFKSITTIMASLPKVLFGEIVILWHMAGGEHLLEQKPVSTASLLPVATHSSTKFRRSCTRRRGVQAIILASKTRSTSISQSRIPECNGIPRHTCVRSRLTTHCSYHR